MYIFGNLLYIILCAITMKTGGYMLPAFFVAKKREKSLKPVDIYINDSIMISVRKRYTDRPVAGA